MKKALLTIVGIMFCGGLMINAAEKPELSPEQQEAKAKLIKKYDADSNGKLDKAERAKMSKEDKQALAKLMGAGKKEKAK